jgi:putative ABC transport system ATP-binding protein
MYGRLSNSPSFWQGPRFRSRKKKWIDWAHREVGWAIGNPQTKRTFGGQRQRVASPGPCHQAGIVLPTNPANLDSARRTDHRIDEKINRELNTTFIFSTHDAKIVDVADHIIRLKDGLIVRTEGSMERIRWIGQ